MFRMFRIRAKKDLDVSHFGQFRGVISSFRLIMGGNLEVQVGVPSLKFPT